MALLLAVAYRYGNRQMCVVIMAGRRSNVTEFHRNV